MKAEEWERVQRHFDRALELAAAERAAYLAELRDREPDLAGEVIALVAAGDRSGDFTTLPGAWLGALGSSEAMRFEPGDRLADRYEIRRLLGTGGMGEVYEAWDEGLSIDVALKVLRVAIDTEEARRRLRVEGLLARAVVHPNVCRVYDLGRHDASGRTVWFLTMERLAGATLQERLRAEGRLAPESARRIGAQLAAALGAAHAAGVVHRDFKPGNVILTERDGQEQAVVTDFGIARALADPTVVAPGSAEGSTLRGPIVGTPQYMAPEQLRGEPGGPACDIYALGVVLYEMTTGRWPFPGGTPEIAARRRLSEDPIPLRDAAPDLDETWEAILGRCLDRDPRRRYARAEDVGAALEGRAGESDGGAAVPSAARYALPAERPGFFGRSHELTALDRLYAGSARLATLVGAAGMGKTRLALRYGWSSLERWPGGVWFCDLRDAAGTDGVATAVARALGATLGRLDPIEQLGDAVAALGRCLVVLDNADRAAEAAAAAATRWIERAPEARFLATSRERLRTGVEEALLPVEPLEPTDALDLFTARARWLLPGFELRDGAEAAAEIVRLLDGMPLAIELAASRVRVMPVAQILEQLRDRFRLLTGGATSRHETLEVAIEGSWSLLAPAERLAWAQCSVFEGGFTADAADAVLDLGDATGRPSALDVLQALADRSLIRVLSTDATDVARVRFALFTSLKEFARRRLEERAGVPGETRFAADASERRHGAWYARFGSDDAIERLDASDGLERRRRLEREIPNLMAACRRAIRRGDSAVAAAAYRAIVEDFSLRGPFGLGIELGATLLDGLDLRGGDRILALWSLSRMERLSGTRAARAHAEEALAAARVASDPRLVALLAGWLGTLEYDEGATDAARAHYDEALAIHVASGDDARAGIVLSHIGILHHVRGDYETAVRHYASSLERLRRAGARRREGFVHGYLGTLHRDRGRFDEALAEQMEALAIHREGGDRLYECQTIGNLGNLHFEMGQLEEARGRYESAVAMAREMGDRRNEGLFLSNLGRLHAREERRAEARSCYETALARHRIAGTRMQEGYALGLLGRLSHEEGRLDDAQSELAGAEAILREVGHHVELGKVLCAKGELELACRDVDAAAAALEETEALAAARGWGPEGELGRMIQSLRGAVSASRSGSEPKPPRPG